jgi:hypothetical protein
MMVVALVGLLARPYLASAWSATAPPWLELGPSPSRQRVRG